MRLYVIAVYHNTDSELGPYVDGHQLQQVVTHWRRTGIDPIQIPDWAWHVFNADLDLLQANRASAEGEADFLIAAVYRLMRYRSLSVGDVIAITTGGVTTWVAYEYVGWRQISAPANLTGQPLTAASVYHHLDGRQR